VNPAQINIEITETATLNSASMVNSNMNSLLDYGVSFSLDDYGSGNANIDYINHMPFKIIKIDKYIIWDSFKNSKAGITLEYTIGMLNALELYIVAEGVETEEMKEKLADFGCHYMQGWLYSKAVPDVEFVELLRTQQALPVY
jgi:EAL domain-containing protein (putative c-di-GMP-specific phosphodiesterase class I)